MVASMWIGNLMLVIINLPLIGIWVKLLTVRTVSSSRDHAVLLHRRLHAEQQHASTSTSRRCSPSSATCSSSSSCEPAPLLLGFILGPMMEENLRRAMLLSRGDWGTFVTRPLSAGLLIAAALLILIVTLPSIGKKREVAFSED